MPDNAFETCALTVGKFTVEFDMGVTFVFFLLFEICVSGLFLADIF